MDEKRSASVAPRSRTKRIKTRYVGVYTREILNRQTGKADTAFDICYDTDGRKIWKTIGYASDGVNAAYANRRRGDILDGISKHEKPKRQAACMTYDQAWEYYREKWLPTLARPAEDEGRHRLYLAAPLGKRRLDAITTVDLENLKATLLRRGLAPATVRLALSQVRRVYRKMAVWGLYDGQIPTVGLVLPKVDNARTRYLTQAEAVRLLDAIRKRSRTWHDIAWLSLHTGMRKGEILHLRGEHLDFGGGQILVKDSKSGSRAIPMTDDVRAFLLERRPPKPEALLFTKRGAAAGAPISIDADESFVRAVADCRLNEGITDRRHRVVFHTLRHTFCSWLAMAGVPLFTIGELVGHTTTQMTRRYSHLCPDTKQEAAAKIGAMLRAQQAKE